MVLFHLTMNKLQLHWCHILTSFGLTDESANVSLFLECPMVDVVTLGNGKGVSTTLSSLLTTGSKTVFGSGLGSLDCLDGSDVGNGVKTTDNSLVMDFSCMLQTPDEAASFG